MFMSQALDPTSFEDISPPDVDLAAIEGLLESRYRIVGTLTPLRAERDQMYRVVTDGAGSFVVRISSQHEEDRTIALQQEVLEAVALHAPSLPVPRLIASTSGSKAESIEHLGTRHAVRVFSYLEGVPVGTTRHTKKQREALGRALAQLDRALSHVTFPSEGNAYLWDVQRSSALRPLVSFNKSAEQRSLCLSVLDDFEQTDLPRLKSVRRQFIHNDFNPKNVLVDPDSPDDVTGIIDFGDMVRSALVADVAVAVARQMTIKTPVQDAAELVAAYNEQLPLTDDELDLVYGLACARLFMRITIWSWRMAFDDPRSQGSQVDEAVKILDALRKAGPAQIRSVLRDACGRASKWN